MQQALYRKYRPAKFSDVVGQEPIKLTLANQVRLGKLGHAYLFAGPKGTGKTTMARILAKAVNCLDPQDGNPCEKCSLCLAADAGSMIDLIEMDAASHTGVDDMREVISGTYTAPALAKYKIYVIDEAHMLSKSAFNALLKTLEEPPSHVIFVLASTEIDKFPATIVSRCQRFDFRPIGVHDIEKYLADIAKREEIDIEARALGLIAQQSGGGMRDGLSLLERAAAMGTHISAASLTEWFGWLDWHQVLELTNLVAVGNKTRAFEMVNDFVANGYDLLTIAKQWTELVSQLLMVRLGVRLERSPDELTALEELSEKVSKDDLVWWLEQLLDLPYRVRTAVLAQLPFELVIIRVADRLQPTGGGVDGGSTVEGVQPVVTEQGVANAEPSVGMSQKDITTPSDIDWKAVAARVSEQSPTLGAVLSQASLRVEGSVLSVLLASNFHKQKLEQSQINEVVSAALAEQGVAMEVRYVVDEKVQEDAKAVDPSKVMEVFG